MSRFRLSPGGRRPHEPWFHIGTLGVTTTWLVVFLSVLGVLLFAVAGSGSTVELNLVAWPGVWDFTGAKPWTLLTWPIAYPDFGIWDALAIFFFWYFGQDVERSIFGRKRFAWVLLIWTVVLGAALVLVDQLNAGWATPLYGLNLLELMVVLLWIAEWPNRMFFFNIPAWAFGVFILVIQLIQYMGHRQWDILLALLIGIVVGAIVARQFGALGEYPWIPRFAGVRRRRPRPVRSTGPVNRPAPRPSGPTVVPGPWTPQVDPRDEARMNELLEKIHEHGAGSLSDGEKAELNELRLRRRGGR